jgi:hypothetical protein
MTQHYLNQWYVEIYAPGKETTLPTHIVVMIALVLLQMCKSGGVRLDAQ